MAAFDVIQMGYSPADETINFGARPIAISENLYEATTLATLKNGDGVGLSDPFINATVQGGLVYFNVDSTLRIFKDTQCTDVIFSAKFEAIIDCFSINSKGLIFIGLRSGVIKILDSNNKFSCVTTEKCARDEESDCFFINSFTDEDRFVFVTKLGEIYVEEKLCIKVVHDFKFRTKVASFQYPLLVVNGSKLGIFDFDFNSAFYTNNNRDFKTILLLDNIIFGLDNQDSLYKICPFTLILCQTTLQFKDIQVIRNDGNIRIITLTDLQKENFLQMLSYPDYSDIFSLKIANNIQLISLTSFDEDFLYISKIVSNSLVTEIRFHKVLEAAPNQTVIRLLVKGKYEDAEKYVRLFNLDVTVIHKAKAEEIAAKRICTSEEIDKLIKLFEVIEDDIFRLQCCVSVESSCTNLEDVRKILSYGCDISLDKVASADKTGDNMQKELMKILNKLNTFQMIHKNAAMSTWREFYEDDVIQKVIKYLENFQIEAAIILYSRLDQWTIDSLSEIDISNILEVLNDVPVKISGPFIVSFVYITLPILPSSLPLLVNWIQQAALLLERQDNTNFPCNAIEFTERLARIIKRTEENVCLKRLCILQKNFLSELGNLLTVLKIFEILKNQYNIEVSVESYLKEPENVIRAFLNIDMAPTNYEEFLKKIVIAYMAEKQMNLNDILSTEIKILMEYDEHYWVNKIGPILNCITSLEIKIETMKYIMEFANLPWHDSVREIALNAIKAYPAFASEIQYFIDYEPVKIVLKTPRYELKKRVIKDVGDLMLVVNRIIYCNEPSMIQDVYQVCNTPEYRRIGSKRLVRHFIKNGCQKQALKLLDDITHMEEKLESLLDLAEYIEQVVNCDIKSSPEFVENFYNVAGSVFTRLIDNVTDKFDKIRHQETLNRIRCVQSLKTNFGLKVPSDNLIRQSTKTVVKDRILDDIYNKFERDFMKFEEVYLTLQKLAHSLCLDFDEILLEFCDKSEDYNIVFKIARQMLERDASSKSLSLMTILLLKYIGNYKLALKDGCSADNSLSDCESSLLIDEFEDVDGSEMFDKGLHLAEIMISKAILKGNDDERLLCMEVAHWAHAGLYLSRHSEGEIRKTLFGDIFSYPASVSVFPVFSTIGKIFRSYCNLIDYRHFSMDTYLTVFNSNTLSEDELCQDLKNLSSSFERMCKEGQQFTCYYLIETLLQNMSKMKGISSSMVTYLKEFLKTTCISKMFFSLLANQTIDNTFLYCLLAYCDPEDCVNLIQSSLKIYKRNPRKFECIVTLGLKIWDLHNISEFKTFLLSTQKTVKWWNKLQPQNIGYDNFFKMSVNDLLEYLISLGAISLDLIKEYCIDFNLDPKYWFNVFLKSIFLKWKPDYEIETINGLKFLRIKNDESILNEVHNLMKIVPEQDILSTIESVWSSINFYYYEVFIAMLNILKEFKSQNEYDKKLKLLLFLINYQRTSQPSQVEVEQWHTSFPDLQTLDPLSEFRLPFTPLLFSKKVISIIRRDLSLRTYKLWFEMIDILKPHLNRDEICSVVVKDVVYSGVLSTGLSDEWNLHKKHTDLFEQIDQCVQYISQLEFATSVMYHLMTHTPAGADQLTAASLCFKYCLLYKNSNPGSTDVQQAAIKVEKKFLTCSALNILYKYKVKEEKYHKLISQPEQLIIALYQDPRLNSNIEISTSCPNINQVTDELATSFGLDIKKIRSKLVHCWLASETPIDFDSPIDNAEDDEGINRIAYICQSDVENWQRELHQHGLNDEEGSTHSRYRALKIFTLISDLETIVSLTELNFEEFRNFVDQMELFSNLEYLGIILDTESLCNLNKKKILKTLVQRSSSFLAIKAMALLCTIYKIFDYKYWEFIVNATVKFAKFTELKKYLIFLKGRPKLYKQFYISAWQILMENTFNHLGNRENIDKCLIENMLDLQSCPVLNSLNFEKIFTICFQKGKIEFAAVLVQYINTQKTDEFIEQIRNSDSNLISKLNHLELEGICGISQVKLLLK